MFSCGDRAILFCCASLILFWRGLFLGRGLSASVSAGHRVLARLRAAETGRPLLFASNAGPSAQIDTRGRVHIAVMAPRVDAVAADPEPKPWGHPTSEIFYLATDADGTDVQCRQISPTDDTTAHWLPNISRGGPFYLVEKPVILYTRGVKGEGCVPTDENEVYAVLPKDNG